MLEQAGSIIGALGFPIVACIGLAWYVKYQTDLFKVQLEHITTAHNNEMIDMRTALNNNTIALQKLCDKLDKE